jgi:hypothetical protein
MSRAGFQKSVRMFHRFSEETMRRRGGDPAGREGVEALAAIEAALKAERLFDGSLLEPLAAFTNLLQSSQLPPDFGDYSFGDALLAIEDAHAELRQNAEQNWEFAPELSDDDAAKLLDFAPREQPAAPSDADAEHARKLSRFVLDAAQSVEPGSALVVGALAAPELPFAELAARFERLTLNDLDLARLEELTRRTVSERHRERVRLERYDPTGSYAAFTRSLSSAVDGAEHEAGAEQALLAVLQSYDVGASSAGLSALEERPNLAISALLLPELGRGYGARIASALSARGWDERRVERAPLLPALTLFRCLLVQHHIHALLRRAKSAVLVSPVSELVLVAGAGGKSVADGEPRDLLSVERLVERLPQIAEIKAEQSWERQKARPGGAEKHSLLTLIEAVLV